MPDEYPEPATATKASTAPGQAQPGASSPAPLGRARMVCVCLALLLEGMSSSSINVQIAAIHTDLALDAGEMQIVASAFLLSYAGLLPLAGRLVDAWNRRAVFLIGVGLFGLGCLACALAGSVLLLGAGRFIQGAGAALSAPAALALITAGLAESARRNRAIALYGAMGAVGFSLGLVLPGAVVTLFGWRASFLLFLPVVLLVLLAGSSVKVAAVRVRQRIEVRSTLLLTGALILSVHLLGAFTTLAMPWLAIEAVALLALVGLLLFRSGPALFPSAVIHSPRILASCLGLSGVFGAVVASMYVLSLGLVARGGADAFVVGLLILPQPLFFSLLSGAGARMVTRFGAPWVFTAGALLLAASLVFLGIVGLSADPWMVVLPSMAGVGAALALCFPAASIGAVDAAPEEFRGTVASLLTTFQNVGGAAGLALVTVLAIVPRGANRIGIEPGMLVSAAVLVLGIGVAACVAGIPATGVRNHRSAAPSVRGNRRW